MVVRLGFPLGLWVEVFHEVFVAVGAFSDALGFDFGFVFVVFSQDEGPVLGFIVGVFLLLRVNRREDPLVLLR